MPSPDERAVWRTQNADLIEFISTPANQRASRFIAAMHRSFEQYGSLTDPQTRASRNVMRELAGDSSSTDDPNQAATPDDAVHIPNGVYTVSDGSEHLTYRIHTVRRGSLQGKRIIKRQLNYGEFKGFAFLTRTGHIKVWRSFYEDEAANERYIVWARLLLIALNERFSDGYSGEDESFEFTYAAGDGYLIQASVYCRRCNRALTDPTSITLGIGPECRSAEQTARTTAADAHEPVDFTSFESLLVQGGVITSSGQGAFVADEQPVVDVAATTSPPIGTHEAALIAQYEEACRITATRGRYSQPACPHCGRNDFRSPQGRGRHVSSCREDSPQTITARALTRLANWRSTNGIVRDDSYQRAINNTAGPNLRALRNRLQQPVAAQRTVRVEARQSVPTAPHIPNPSALGTVFNGQVWDQ